MASSVYYLPDSPRPGFLAGLGVTVSQGLLAPEAEAAVKAQIAAAGPLEAAYLQRTFLPGAPPKRPAVPVVLIVGVGGAALLGMWMFFRKA